MALESYDAAGSESKRQGQVDVASSVRFASHKTARSLANSLFLLKTTLSQDLYTVSIRVVLLSRTSYTVCRSR
ncbi:hypothetical protein RTBOTA2_003690 [Rhodotorula toruloides]|nr:hypothetical protein RTBOTA2_003690 [Rhodotorula toruloides]